MTVQPKTNMEFWSPVYGATQILTEKKASSIASDAGLNRLRTVKNSVNVLNNCRNDRFLALFDALNGLAGLPVEDSFHLDPIVSKKATDFAAMIFNNLNIDAPRMFPQDKTAAVFTWDTGKIKKLLTVDAEYIDIMDINKETFVKCSYDISSVEPNNELLALNELGKYYRNSSSLVENNV